MHTSIQGFRLSPQQKRLWLIQGGGRVYRAGCAAHIDGALDPNALAAAVRCVADRHEILRTTFYRTPGIKLPIQVVAERGSPAWQHIDLSDRPRDEQTDRLDAIFGKLNDAPLDYGTGPLFHATLVTHSAHEATLLLSLPALCADAQTLDNLIREIGRAYRPENEDSPEDIVQYVQFSEWQNELLESEDAEPGKAYWQTPLSFDAMSLPYEDHPTALPGFEPVVLSATLEAKLVVALARRLGVSVADCLIAGWQVLLWRLIEQPDIVIGQAFSGRKYDELQGALGLFGRWLPVRNRLEAGDRFDEVASRAHRVADEASTWQEYFTGEGDESFPFGFEFEVWPEAECIGELTFSLVKKSVCLERYKVKLACVQAGDALRVEFHYDPALFAAEAIACLMSQYGELLKSAAANPTATLDALNLIDEAGRQHLLVAFNDTQAIYPVDRCAHHLFETQVERTPGKVAVVYREQSLTYAELNARADRLANYLRASGVGPETIVGLCLERSIEMLVGVLGVLKAGGAYLPLDAAHPPERLAFMLEDARVSIVLTTSSSNLHALNDLGVRYVRLDIDSPAILHSSFPILHSSLSPDNLAYVIYTSGSTGKPKGVMISHRGLVNYLSWAAQAYHVDQGGGAPVHSPLSFDLTVTSLLAPLIAGGRVLLLPEEQGVDALSAVLSEGRDFSLIKLTPSHLDALRHDLRADAAGRTRVFVIGGEALRADSLTFWQAHAPDTRLINEYGPTETVVGCCVYEVPARPMPPGSIPIGRPIANTQLYVLDDRLWPVPIGAIGELYVGGDGLARGYLNRPDLTAEKFVPIPPFSPPSKTGGGVGSRLYRTGDLVRHRPDGNLEFVGRIDHQVKVRGFRVELGEIEAALARHPAVRETVAVMRQEPDGDRAARLVAYIVLRDGQEPPAVNELRRFLSAHLPDYMLPATFAFLDALPLTPNGKVDRRALPAPGTARPRLSGDFVTPRTHAEEVLADIWAQVLGMPQVGIHDNFFELGGDSILGIQAVARANQAGLHLLPRQLFEYQTVAELAAVAGTLEAIQAEQGLVTGSLPLTPIQRWFFEQQLADAHHWNQAHLLDVRRSLDPAVLHATVRHLLLHHDALRLRFTHDEACGWRQVIAEPDGNVPFIWLDLSALPESMHRPAIESAAAQAQASLNLQAGPLMRIAFFGLGSGRSSRLLLSIHHLAVDGVSWRVLLEDVQTIYQQLERGQPVALPPKTTSYKQWAEHLAELAESASFQRELAYWLGDVSQPAASLPIDLPRDDAANGVASARTVVVALDAQETRALLLEAHKAYATQINDLLIAALGQAFARWTGAKDALIDLEGHGRLALLDAIDVSRTVGWFTTIFPMQLDLRKATHPAEMIKSIKEQLRRVPHRGLGYGLLRYLNREAGVGEKLRERPQAEVMFNYFGQFDQMLPEESVFATAQESGGSRHSPRGRRRYLLDISSYVVGGQLHMEFRYSENLHHRATIQVLADGFIDSLRALVAHCLSPEAGGYTPSDFPEAEVSQDDLDSLMARLSG